MRTGSLLSVSIRVDPWLDHFGGVGTARPLQNSARTQKRGDVAVPARLPDRTVSRGGIPQEIPCAFVQLLFCFVGINLETETSDMNILLRCLTGMILIASLSGAPPVA